MIMKLPNDPVILLSTVNSKLRDFYPSLAALCEDLQVDDRHIEEQLKTIDYVYDPQTNRFV